jgi:thiamine biosynthesis lipoprotein
VDLSIKTMILCIPLLILLLFRKPDQQQYTLHGFAQGTSYSIKYFAEKLMVKQGAVDSILTSIDSSMSLYQPYSLINRFNSSTKGLIVDRHFKTVMQKSFSIYDDTKGRFDVTVAPLVQAWGFGPKPVSSFPDSAAIKLLLENVGMNYIRLKGDRLIKLKPGVHVDLNGIAQGYSVDALADYLTQKGLTSYVVEIGGELRMKGMKPDGSAFKVGIEGPSPDTPAEPQIRHAISFTEGAVTTSGNYRKYLLSGNRKVSHLIDPRTGYPLNNRLISVTIYAKDALTADGYDNAVMAMDIKEALAFVSARKDMEAYIIYYKKDGTVADTLTAGFKKMIVN